MKNNTIQENIKNILELLGENVSREGLKETPSRVEKAFQEVFSGYKIDDKSLYKLFTAPNNEIIIVKNIKFTSFCEHHILPFSGTISIGYIPNKYIIGLSKFARIVDCFAKRLQLQEKLTNDILKSINKYLQPIGAVVLVKAQHQCMMCRGVKQKDCETITLAKSGVFENMEKLDVFLKMCE